VEVIDKQVDAYNARDIDGFLACYASGAVVEDGHSNVLMRGREAIRAEYDPFFRDFPSLRGEVIQRISVGEWTVDEEVITGWEPHPVNALVAYHVSAGRIDRVLLLS
jgi:hypothetical protein